MPFTTAIAVRNVSKKFRLFASPKERLMEALHPFRKQYHREFWALRDVSFEVGRGEIVGILGRNGSGKSTLLQIICSVMQATQGEVHVNGRISALLELGAGFNPEFTGRDNVILNGAIMGLSRKEMLRKLPEIEAFADIGEFFDQPVKTYSSGMFVRVAFAAAIHVDPDILVVDEALSVGDSKFQHRCFQRIREFMEQGKTILVVSHSTDTLLRICHRGVVVDAGKLRHVGSIASAVNYYQDLLFGSTKKTESSPDGKRSPIATSLDASTKASLLIGALSGDLDDRISEKPCYNKHETRLGKCEAKIIDFDLIVDDGVNPHEIPTHKEIQLIVKIRFDESLSGVSVGFALVSIDGTYIFGTNLAMMGMPLISADAGKCHAVRFLWKSHIAGGEYFLNIGCNQFADGEDRYLDVRRSVARLKFSDTPGTTGFVDLEITHEVIELPVSKQVGVQ
jgi:lipopolysaccharide transport system ATP-binding protein